MLLSCDELTTAAMIRPSERKAIDAEADENEERNEIAPAAACRKTDAREHRISNDARQIENDAR